MPCQLVFRYSVGADGLPHEVAQLVLFLASDESSYISGSGYLIEGGATRLSEAPKHASGVSWQRQLAPVSGESAVHVPDPR